MREFVLASFVAGYLVQVSPSRPFPRPLAECFSDDINFTTSSGMLTGVNILQAVRSSGDGVLRALLHLDGNVLPFLLLLPEQVARIPTVLFSNSMGILPAICKSTGTPSQTYAPSEYTRQQANTTTVNIILALAKYFQEIPSSPSSVSIFGLSGLPNINNALSILFYYLALSISPSPSTFNNMGIVLASASSAISWTSDTGETDILSGADLAKIFYRSGLQLDPLHPHLLTNLGSSYKDEGNLEAAIQLYSKALMIKPDFDVALTNMGNAVKDSGRSWEALNFYRRALDINPDIPEALCGLVSSMSSICDWRGRQSSHDECGVDDDGRFIQPGATTQALMIPCLMQRMISTCSAQLDAAYSQNIHCITVTKPLNEWLHPLGIAFGRPLTIAESQHWGGLLRRFDSDDNRLGKRLNEGGFIIRFVNWLLPKIQRRWYLKLYGNKLLVLAGQEIMSDRRMHSNLFPRPKLPGVMSPPVVPAILPFNTFMYAMDSRMNRLIAHRNALRISHTTLSRPWLPDHVYPPPGPPCGGVLNVAYLTNDVNNHPLSHLMQSVFGLHDRQRFRIFIYSTSPWDGTPYQLRISGDVEVFVDASTWSTQQIVEHIVDHNIHILINLGGYTKGARNDVLAARPSPIQIHLMGYAGTLGAGWCDYLVCDPMACPPELGASELWRMARNTSSESTVPDMSGSANNTLFDLGADPDPEVGEWVYCEKFIYMPHSFMVTDHKQSFRSDESLAAEERRLVPHTTLWQDEERRRYDLKRMWFPALPLSWVIFANFNQLYKIDPGIFAVWLRILKRVPNSILWLLRFPAQGEEHLIRTAKLWGGEEIASRLHFTDIARKDVHVARGRVADLFLDTVECNAHTIAADVLWSGTPILTLPKHKHKMCSRVAASMANATGFGDQMIVHSLEEYEHRAVTLANSVKYTPWLDLDGVTIQRGEGELIKLRRNLFLNRDGMPLFDTKRWTRNIEKAYCEAWKRWVEGTQYEQSDEWKACGEPEKRSGAIWVSDNEPVDLVCYD